LFVGLDVFISDVVHLFYEASGREFDLCETRDRLRLPA
jgi:hypothetical protein